MSELPTNWTAASFGEIAAEPIELRGPEPGSFTYVDISSIDKQTKQIVSPQELEGANAPSRAKQRLQSNDVLVSMTRPNLNAVARVPDELNNTIGSTGFCILRSSQLNGRWLQYRVQSHDFVDEMSSLVQGALYPAVRPKDVFNFRTLLPPRAEQDRIADEIEKQFTRLDDAVAALKRVQVNLKRYRASVLKAACEGRLVPTEAELARKVGRSYEPAGELLKRILAERGAKWEADQLQKMIAAGKPPKNDAWRKSFEELQLQSSTDLPQLPSGWIWTTCGVIADAIDPQPSHRTPPEFAGGVPYIGMGDVTSEQELSRNRALKVHPSVLKEHRERYALHIGDFFVGKIGTLGKPVRVSEPFDYALSANIVLIQPHNLIDPRFLFYWMGTPAVERILIQDSRATTQAAFGIKRFRTLACPLPPIIEQRRIADEIERRLSATAVIEKDLRLLVARSGQCRQAVLKNGFSGKLVPQDPNDEPASVLLERIHAEHAALANNNGHHKGTLDAGTNNKQRQRRGAKLAQRGSAGKGAKKMMSAVGAAQK